MDKKIILAVAGAGKTTQIINSLTEDKKAAIITYTKANQDNLKKEVIKKFGYIPRNITIFGFFEFIYTFCLIPCTGVNLKGILFDQAIQQRYSRRKTIIVNGYILSNKISKYLIQNDVPYIARINKYFDELYIDEIQDFNSFDIDWVCSLASSDVQVTLVGDYYQKTFVTSRLGTKGTGIKTIDDFKTIYANAGFIVDEVSFNKSHRCIPEICEFIRNNLGIEIYSHKSEGAGEVKYVDTENDIYQILNDNKIKKLFYHKHYNYFCNSSNWGESKGNTFDEVCVVLNPTTLEQYRKGQLSSLAPQTRLKFYVACTRTANNLYFIDQKKIPVEFKK